MFRTVGCFVQIRRSVLFASRRPFFKDHQAQEVKTESVKVESMPSLHRIQLIPARGIQSPFPVIRIHLRCEYFIRGPVCFAHESGELHQIRFRVNAEFPRTQCPERIPQADFPEDVFGESAAIPSGSLCGAAFRECSTAICRLEK